MAVSTNQTANWSLYAVYSFAFVPIRRGIMIWMDEWLAILRPFQQYFSHIRTMGRWLWTAMCNWSPFTVEKISPRAGIELGTARSVGQRLIHLATGAPSIMVDIWKRRCVLITGFNYKILKNKILFVKQCVYTKKNTKCLYYKCFSEKTDVPSPTHSYPYFFCLKCISTNLFYWPNLCSVDILFQVQYVQEYLKSFCFIISSACLNNICTKRLITFHLLVKEIQFIPTENI